MSGADLLTGVVAGVVAAFAWAALAWLNRQRRYWQLKRWNGTYRIRQKTTGKIELETVTIRATGNLLTIRFANTREGESVTGRVVMNERTLKDGRGQYDHPAPTGPGWGFWDMQLKDPQTILVHTTFAATNDTAVFRGYIWEKVRPAA